MFKLTIEARFEALDAHITRGTLIRYKFSDGYDHACILFALAPEVGCNGVFSQCPAELMPAWMAYLTTAVSDNGSEAAWPAMVCRFSQVVRQGTLHLDTAGWGRVLARFVITLLQHVWEGRKSQMYEYTLTISLWQRIIAGASPAKSEWLSAMEALRNEAQTFSNSRILTCERALLAAAIALALEETPILTMTRQAERVVGIGANNVDDVKEAEEKLWDHVTPALLDAIECEVACATYLPKE